MSTWIYALASVVGVSLVALVGIFALSRRREEVERITPYLVSLAVGGLLGGAVLHLIPRAAAGAGLGVWLYLLAGFVGSFVLEKFLQAHRAGHASGQDRQEQEGGERPLVGMVLLGDAIHNLLDGVVIAASYSLDPWVGLATTLVVFLHEVPQEVGDFGVLLHGGLSVRRALLYNALSASTAIAGALLTLWLSLRVEQIEGVVLPIAAGNFLYIAAADLVPELHEKRGRWMAVTQVAIIAGGIGLMLGIRLLRESILGGQGG